GFFGCYSYNEKLVDPTSSLNTYAIQILCHICEKLKKLKVLINHYGFISEQKDRH
ncbi:unnamed protein product, partial [Gulo gulo]